MAKKPSYGAARAARKHGTATMTIEPAPKTSFTDKNLDSDPELPKNFKMSKDNAKPGESVSSPESNMPNPPTKIPGFLTKT